MNEQIVERPAYQQRVVDETIELGDELDRLRIFVGSDMFTLLPSLERSLLYRQLGAMAVYYDILHERIAVFGGSL